MAAPLDPLLIHFVLLLHSNEVLLNGKEEHNITYYKTYEITKEH